MNNDEFFEDDSNNEYIPYPLKFEDNHQSDDCIFCNILSKKYIKPHRSSLNKLFAGLNDYRTKVNRIRLLRVISDYRDLIMVPCNELLLSGKCGSGYIPYPDITTKTVTDHCESYSNGNFFVNRNKQIDQACRIIEDQCLFYVDNGNKKLNLEVADRWMKMIQTSVKIAQLTQKKK